MLWSFDKDTILTPESKNLALQTHMSITGLMRRLSLKGIDAIWQLSLGCLLMRTIAHMPSAYGLGKNTIFNKVQFSSVQQASYVILVT